MPNYRFGKGPISVTLENLLADRDKAKQLLGQLYKNIGPDELIVADELEQRFGPVERNHFNNVFGENLPAEIQGVERELAEREGPQRLTVFREGMRRAILLILGLDKDLAEADLAAAVPRDPPFLVDVYWGCAQPYNETWVSWRKTPDGGFVSVVFLLTLIGTNLGRAALEDFQPADLDEDRGLIVCHGDPNGKWDWFKPRPDVVGIP